MITNDEAVELLDYIAMNDLENAYDAERDAISADTMTFESWILRRYDDELPY
jgi:hypothetical protein